MKTMPKQKRHRSKQDYVTPWAFIDAVVKRWGPLKIDLAASKSNARCGDYIDIKENFFAANLLQRIGNKNAWLNPPFTDIAPWARKCARFGESSYRGRIFFLVPASVGANWFADYVYQKAYVLPLQGRLVFEGETDPYPKDMMLAIYGGGFHGFEPWNWTGRARKGEAI